MATATVFIDDAVLGRLPPLCAKSGATTPDHLVQTSRVSSGVPAVAWLLLFLGPLGWLALFIYACVQRDETITVRLPYSDTANDALQQARWRRRAFGWGALVSFSGAFLILFPQNFAAHTAAAALAVIGIGLTVSWGAEAFHVRSLSVGVQLDASRRWVTLSRVDDDFARAVSDRNSGANDRSLQLQP